MEKDSKACRVHRASRRPVCRFALSGLRLNDMPWREGGPPCPHPPTTASGQPCPFRRARNGHAARMAYTRINLGCLTRETLDERFFGV